MERFFLSDSENMTKRIAMNLAKKLSPGDLITLSGELGTGKTTFTKGLASGLDIKRTVTSPTFTIMKEYKGRLPLYHIDAYRLEGSEEDIGLSEYIESDGVTVIEWATFIEQFLPEDRFRITLLYKSESTRHIKIQAVGNHYSSILEALDMPKENLK